MNNFFFQMILIFSIAICSIPEKRIVAEWEQALGTMIRWPLGIPNDLVFELARDDSLYVLVESINEQVQASNTFSDIGIDLDQVVFINTDTYSHWTRDYGPQFLIGEDYWKVINQDFNGYPLENGCNEICDDSMILYDCLGNEFCNNLPLYPEEGYDCYVNNHLCQDFNGDGQIIDWLGDGYCDNGSWGLNFMCNEYSFDCGDCGGEIIDEIGYCNESFSGTRVNNLSQTLRLDNRGWDEDDNTNIDFANQLNWDILNLPLYFTGGNLMTDGYGNAFSTELMINENNLNSDNFIGIIQESLNVNNYHIFDNPNFESIQHIDCMAKLVNPETVIIKQVSQDSPEYDCVEEFANSFIEINSFYDRPYNIHRIFCPEIVGGPWETNPVAAYTNSLILNQKVLVPLYGIDYDLQAIEVYQDAMPGYEVIGFEGATYEPWYSEDALHCRTMGIFDPSMIHISHKKIMSNEIFNNLSIVIETEIIDYGNLDMPLDSVIVYWKYSNDNGPYNQINLYLESNNDYIGEFPFLSANSSIDYFISVTNINGKKMNHPASGWHIFNTLSISLGDLNNDLNINVQDIILIIDVVLNMEYENLADLNFDQIVDVLDIVQLVNIILNN
ncbi:MAG: hypothetical protein CMG07_04410 [Candidatus Marinimicrobia bacterium]|nr:hypothetical protein [Candidatus Neomarinimicrobiota bacterium]